MAIMNQRTPLNIQPDTTLRDIISGVSGIANTVANVGSFVNQIKQQDDQRQYAGYQQTIKEKALDKGIDPYEAAGNDKQVFDALTALKRYHQWGHFNKDADPGLRGTKGEILDTANLTDTNEFVKQMTGIDAYAKNYSKPSDILSDTTLDPHQQATAMLTRLYVDKVKGTVGDALDESEKTVLMSSLNAMNGSPENRARFAYGLLKDYMVAHPDDKAMDNAFKDTERELKDKGLINGAQEPTDGNISPTKPDATQTMQQQVNMQTGELTGETTPQVIQPIQAVDAQQALNAIKKPQDNKFELFRSIGEVAPGYEKYKGTQAYSTAANNAYQAIPQAIENSFKVQFTPQEAKLVSVQYNNPDVLKMVNDKLKSNMSMEQWTAMREGFAHTMAVNAMNKGNPAAIDPKLATVYFPNSAAGGIETTQPTVEQPTVEKQNVSYQPQQPQAPQQKYTTQLGVGIGDIEQASQTIAFSERPQPQQGETTEAYKGRLQQWQAEQQAANQTINGLKIVPKVIMSVPDNQKINWDGTPINAKLLKAFISTDAEEADTILNKISNAARGRDTTLENIMTDPMLNSIADVRRLGTEMQKRLIDNNKAAEGIFKAVFDTKEKMMKLDVDWAKLKFEQQKEVLTDAREWAKISAMRAAAGSDKQINAALDDYYKVTDSYTRTYNDWLKSKKITLENDPTKAFQQSLLLKNEFETSPTGTQQSEALKKANRALKLAEGTSPITADALYGLGKLNEVQDTAKKLAGSTATGTTPTNTTTVPQTSANAKAYIQSNY